MLILKRHLGESFFIQDPQDNNKILFELILTDIDRNGEFIKLKWKWENRVVEKILNDIESAVTIDDVTVYFKGVFLHRNKLSVTIGFDTEYKVIRHELLNAPVRITPENANKIRST